MFNFFKKKATEITTPAAGEVILLDQVSDPVFAQKMMGDGFAVEPTADTIYAPVTGTVTNVFPTKHAVSFKTENGIELLLHLGIDTVSLNGEGFTLNVAENQNVTAGDVIGTMDLAAVKSAGKETTIMVVFPEAKETVTVTPQTAVAKTVVAKLS